MKTNLDSLNSLTYLLNQSFPRHLVSIWFLVDCFRYVKLLCTSLCARERFAKQNIKRSIHTKLAAWCPELSFGGTCIVVKLEALRFKRVKIKLTLSQNQPEPHTPAVLLVGSTKLVWSSKCRNVRNDSPIQATSLLHPARSAVVQRARPFRTITTLVPVQQKQKSSDLRLLSSNIYHHFYLAPMPLSFIVLLSATILSLKCWSKICLSMRPSSVSYILSAKSFSNYSIFPLSSIKKVKQTHFPETKIFGSFVSCRLVQAISFWSGILPDCNYLFYDIPDRTEYGLGRDCQVGHKLNNSRVPPGIRSSILKRWRNDS